MAINFEGKTYDQDWFEIDAMGRRLSDKKDWTANADYASKTGTQNPYTNQAGSSPYDTSGFIPGNEPGSTLPKGPASGGWVDQARINAYAKKLSQPQFSWPAPSQAYGYTPPQTSGGASRQAPSGGSTNPAVYTDMEQARQGLANVYRTSLGREASADEISGWLSGSYGHGSGLQDYDKFVNAIMGSDEARRYRGDGSTPSGQPAGYHGIEYWQQAGTPPVDIFDPLTGQLRNGWQRTGTGYERTGGASVPGPQGGNYQSWFQQLVGGKRVSPRTLKELEPILNQYGIKLGPLNARGFTDGIVLPDGTFVDVIQAATEDGGGGWAWMIPGPGGASGGGPTAPPNQFNDPYTQYLEQMLTGRIGQLQQPINDPARSAYEAQLRQRATDLQRATPELEKLISYLETRFKDLQGAGYTGAEHEAIRTGALDPIETDRAAAKQRVLERLSARGITLESGVAQQALNEVDKAFDAMRGTTQTALVTNDLNRREGRQQRAEGIRSTLAQIPEGRARESLDVYSTLSQLSQLARAEQDARSREAIGYGGMLSDLGPQRLQLAMQAAGLGGNPASMFSSLMQLAQLNQQSSLYNNQNQGALWSGLGSIAAILANAGR